MKMKILFFLCVLALLFGFGGCAGGTPPAAGEGGVSVTEPATHKVTSGLHKIQVGTTEYVLADAGSSEYSIVIPADADERTEEAASLLRTHMANSCGVGLPVLRDGSLAWSQDAKWIILGSEKLFSAAGLAMPADDIGRTGYYIKNAGSSVFIAANASFGILNGALEFLEHAVGYEMYSDDTVVYTAGERVMLPDFDVIDKPDFEFFVASNRMSEEGMRGMRYMDLEDIFIPVEGLLWHNTFAYLDPDDYPDRDAWFSPNKTQLCYTAHGIGEEYTAMMQAFMAKLIEAVNAAPEASTVTITIEDNTDFCTCTACSAEREKYGTDSAVVVKFCNDVSDRLAAYFEEQAQAGAAPREVDIMFFAYYKTSNPPVRMENGTYVPVDDSVVCRENVGVYIAPITASYSQDFYSEANSATAASIEGWGAVSDNLYMWLYETNYSHYLYPFDSFDTIGETFRFCKENGAVFMFSEGQYNQYHVTAFGKLKEYYNSKAMWDVNTEFSAVCDTFFPNYFREAAAPMRAYFEELQMHMKYLASAYPAEVNGNIYNNIAQARFWPKRTLDRWAEYIDEAYAAVARYETTSPTLYAALVKHIKIESIFIRFAQITLHVGSYSENTLREMRSSFKADCAELSITMLRELETLDAVFNEWGV